ncbi:MAG: hypothetical protein OXF79_05515 [Chloroflexi bacterium]|nr:hypothetical protein [Chloroflexota bacterium]
MRHIFVTQHQLRWALFGAAICAAAALTLALARPSDAYSLDPGSDHVIGHTSTHTNASPWNAVEHERRGTARVLLAKRLGVSAEDLEFVSEQAVNWPDTSLGCGQPGHVYAKVIVPGYRIMFAYEGASYEVHTAVESGFGPALPPVSCEGGIAYDRATEDPAG